MINKLRFDEAFRPAMQLVFGKTLICRNLEVASQFSKSENLDCITLEGILRHQAYFIICSIRCEQVPAFILLVY